MEKPIEFTVNEQNCLAMVCQVMAKIHYGAHGPIMEAASISQDYALCEIVERFPSINWGELYDKFHRQGKNR